MNIVKRMNEIRERQAEIRTLLESNGDVNIEDITKELRELETEYLGLEQRKNALDTVNSGGAFQPAGITNPVAQRSDESGVDILSTKEYRNAWAKTLMCQPLTDTEQRALNTALTTTATTFSAATSSADGVNNGGLFIPTEVNTALMQAIGQVSPLFNDAAKTNIPGVVKFPYRKSGSGADHRIEGVANTDGSIEWAELVLGTSEISETIRVSWKLESMTPNEFIGYIMQELTEQIQDKAVNTLIYGDGNNKISGITKNAKKCGYSGDVLSGIASALSLLPKKQKIGAKLYVSNSIIETISFMKDNDGKYIYSPINSVGVNSIATYTVEVDPYLNDGDFVIGNMSRYYRLNTNEALSITKDISGKNRINDYTGYMLISGALQPETMVWGTYEAG